MHRNWHVIVKLCAYTYSKGTEVVNLLEMIGTVSIPDGHRNSDILHTYVHGTCMYVDLVWSLCILLHTQLYYSQPLSFAVTAEP